MRPGIIAVLDVVVMYFSSLAKSAYKNNKYTVKWQRSKMLRCSDKSKSTYGSNKRTDTMTLSLWTLVCDYIYIYVIWLGKSFLPILSLQMCLFVSLFVFQLSLMLEGKQGTNNFDSKNIHTRTKLLHAAGNCFWNAYQV